MSKVINISELPVTITVANTYGTEDYVPSSSEVALEGLQFPKNPNAIWNTGCAIIGDPHIDEIARGDTGAALVIDSNPWNAKHIASFRLYRSNEFVYLTPGSSITVVANSTEEAVYYANLEGEYLAIEADFVEEEADAESADTFAAQLNRTTGVGDFDDGDDANGTYPFQFDTEEATEGHIGKYNVTITGGTVDKEVAAPGEVITITPEAGKTNIATEPEVTVTGSTFVMPASDIAITCTE